MSLGKRVSLGQFVSVPAELRDLFDPEDVAWASLSKLGDVIVALGDRDAIVPKEGPTGAPIYIHPSASVGPFVHIVGPAYIGPNVEIRHAAYIREAVVLLEGSTVGHGSEIKNSVLFPHAAVPHLSYVGDSLLGHRVNLGAGTILSNLSILDHMTISIPVDDEVIDTGRRKFGAVIGDRSSVGCNAVINPGVLLGSDTNVYALVSLRKGVYPAHSILKATGAVPVIKREYAPTALGVDTAETATSE